MFGGMANKLSMLRRKSVASDVTPNTVDFGDPDSENPITSNLVTFTGINTTITIRVELAYNDGYTSLSFKKNNGVPQDRTNLEPFTISVSPNDTIQFFVQIDNPGASMGLNIYNQSDGDALLDNPTFTRFMGV